MGTRTVAVDLRPSASRRITVPLDAFPADRQAGQYYFVVDSDNDNAVSETTKFDNFSASRRPVLVGPRAAMRGRGPH